MDEAGGEGGGRGRGKEEEGEAEAINQVNGVQAYEVDGLLDKRKEGKSNLVHGEAMAVRTIPGEGERSALC